MQAKTEKYVEGILPVLPVKDTVVFPNMVVPILIKTNKYLPMIQEAIAKDKIVFVVSSPENGKEEKSVGDLPEVGTVCKISKFSTEEDGNVLVVQGLSRGSVVEIVSRDPVYKAQVKGIEDLGVIGPEIDAIKAALMKQFTELVQISTNIPDEVLRLCRNVEDPSTLADMIAAYSNINRRKKQQILETLDVEKRLESMIQLIDHELQLARMGRQIQTQVQKGIDKSQREYLLREQLKAIQKELGMDDEGPTEIQELHQRMEKKKLPEAALKVATKEISKLSKMNPASSEYSVSMNYLDLLLELPWSESTRDSIDIRKAEKILNQHHYDLEKVKKRILEYLAVRKLNPAHKGTILCFYGPPGPEKPVWADRLQRPWVASLSAFLLGG